MKSKAFALGGLAIAALTISGCNTVGSALGVTKKTPDEFKVVTKAPLVVPPEFALRPPAVGAELPQELDPQRRGRTILFGQEIGGAASAGERALVQKAGATATDADIRTRVDYEESEIIRKPKGLVSQVLDFVPLTNEETDEDGNPLDPDAEKERLAKLSAVNAATGGGEVVIERGKGGFKLPGT